MNEAFWEHYSHPADMGIRGFGPTKEEAFNQAALALTAVITDLQTVQPKETVEITCRQQDDELLFASWLNALIYEMATRLMLFSKFEISIKNHRLKANAWGEKIDLKRHNPAVEVKAATYADLKVRQNKNGEWMVQCIVDV
jgi:SHS2 domain-containing protein